MSLKLSSIARININVNLFNDDVIMMNSNFAFAKNLMGNNSTQLRMLSHGFTCFPGGCLCETGQLDHTGHGHGQWRQNDTGHQFPQAHA